MFRRDPLADPERVFRRVYSYVAYRIGDGPEAEDVTSETLERALRYRGSYDPSLGEPIAWILGIARRCLADSFDPVAPVLTEPPESPAPGDLEEDTARRLSLTAAVSNLSERERELIALRYGADLTARQISELLGLKRNAVEVALHRALARLRDALDQATSSPPELGAIPSESPPVRVKRSRPV